MEKPCGSRHKATVTVQKQNGCYLCSFPYDPGIVSIMRELPGRTWLAEKKVWTIPEEGIQAGELRKRLEGAAVVEFMFEAGSGQIARELERCEEHLKRRRYSRHTVKSYLYQIRLFLEQHPDIQGISAEQITQYINRIAEAGTYSSSYQNVVVNAVKFYTETVCGQKMPQVALSPKREKRLPTVLSEQEIAAILRSLTNTKHKTILSLIYSAGLRVSEAVSLKIADIDFDRAPSA